MSTFNGLVAEFPNIRVDFFRSQPDLRPPLACFLSHIHSDHLAGLENFRSSFVYCSAATRAMLLRLERYPCRINYANGILEARIQRYRHLKNLLKPIPLDTPTVLELEPGNHLQVTLFNANHCPGAVMFLFEGQGKAVLYTGDIRSEPWYVNAIARAPSLVEYTTGLKTLDTIYLDTSFVDNLEFPTKSEGIHELLQKVSRYPADTIFHFQAWTYGYEDVWIALSKALGSKIHVDEYKMSMFRALFTPHSGDKFAPWSHLAPEAPALVGFMCGNMYHPGCLTLDEKVRIHSCEKGNYCRTVKESPVVWIRPIITRLPDGQDVAEVGVGGGGDDLEREAELDYLAPDDVESLLDALRDVDDVPEEVREQARQFLLRTIANGRKVQLDLERAFFGENNEADLTTGLRAMVSKLKAGDKRFPANDSDTRALPNVVTFPYSRHSSYPELCDLVRTFKPRDVWPCTIDVPRWLRGDITVERLFSDYCSGDEFRHDKLMKERFGDHEEKMIGKADTQVTASSVDDAPHISQDPVHEPVSTHRQPSALADGSCLPQSVDSPKLDFEGVVAPEVQEEAQIGDSWVYDAVEEMASFGELDPTSLQDSQDSAISVFALEAREQAFRAILENAKGRGGGVVGLLSTTDNHYTLEDELTYLGP